MNSNHLRLFLLLIYFLVLIGCAAQSNIRPSAITETNDLGQVMIAAEQFAGQFSTENVLIVFDLDNTLLTMDSMLGSVPWYDWQSEMSKTAGCQPGELQDRFAAQGVLYFLGSMHPVQDDASEIIAKLQQTGFRVMVLTARGKDYKLETSRELNRNRMGFSSLTAAGPGYQSQSFTPPNAAREVLYQQGVLMVAGQHKGLMLEALYTELGLSLPQAVVMADDSLQNLKDMQETLVAANIPHQLYRYGLADVRVNNFDSRQAVRDWQQLLPGIDAITASMSNQNLIDSSMLTGCNSQ